MNGIFRSKLHAYFQKGFYVNTWPQLILCNVFYYTETLIKLAFFYSLIKIVFLPEYSTFPNTRMKLFKFIDK